MSERILFIDPGETTGWSVWKDGEEEDSGQTPLWEFIDWLSSPMYGDMGSLMFVGKFDIHTFDRVVCEDWSLYPKEMRSGALDWDRCLTARGIGALELICRWANKPIEFQPAKIKQAAVAAGAEAWFCHPLHENRHMNDAKMHAVFYFAHHNGAPASQVAG